MELARWIKVHEGLNPKPDKNLASYTPEFSTYNFF